MTGKGAALALLFTGGVGSTAVGGYAFHEGYSNAGATSQTTDTTSTVPGITPTVDPSKQPNATPASGAVTTKQELEEWVKATFTDKCTLHLKKGAEFKELKDTSVTVQDVEGLKDFLDKENKITPLCAYKDSGQRQVRVEWTASTKAGTVENETYRVRKLIGEKFTGDRKCDFKFKAKDASDFKGIEELNDDKATGLHKFLSDGFTNNNVCPKMASPRTPPASKEEKIENKSGTWQLPSDGEES